ncbi:MAG: tetratricopeptide repeat protein [Planctomycetes bacterium]|nr:tetratricopeptide repeat protein [Planctomycetota bacterium]
MSRSKKESTQTPKGYEAVEHKESASTPEVESVQATQSAVAVAEEDNSKVKSVESLTESTPCPSAANCANDSGSEEYFAQNSSSSTAKQGASVAGPKTNIQMMMFSVLAVTERILNQLMFLYKSIFVINHQIKTIFFKEKGFTYFDKGNYPKALEQFSSSLEKENSDDAEVLFYKGLSHANLNEFADAEASLLRANELEPNDHDILRELGNTCYKQERHKDAIKMLNASIELKPEQDKVLYTLGSAYEKLEQYEDAYKMFNLAIDLQPTEPLYQHALGFAYEANGRHEDAMKQFRNAMELESTRS